MALGDKLPLLPLASFKLLLLMLSKRYTLCNQMSALVERQDRRDVISCVFEPQNSRKQTAESSDARRLTAAPGTH